MARWLGVVCTSLVQDLSLGPSTCIKGLIGAVTPPAGAPTTLISEDACAHPRSAIYII